MIRLRGHHLLCQFGYQGKGYSEAFCFRMTQMMKALSEQPTQIVKLLVSPDDLCEVCPNLKNGACRTCEDPLAEVRISNNDRQLLSDLQIDPESEVAFSEILVKFAELYSLEQFEKLCISCEWEPLGYCEAGLKRHLREDFGNV